MTAIGLPAAALELRVAVGEVDHGNGAPSGDLLSRFAHAARIDHEPGMTEPNKFSLALENGSRIVSLPCIENTLRGFSGAALIVEDEAARVDDVLSYRVENLTDATYQVLRRVLNARSHG